MDRTTGCLKKFVISSTQYRNNPCEETCANLLRELDDLVAISSKGQSIGFFDPHQLLPTECLTCLDDILSDPNPNSHLMHSAVSFLDNLANDAKIREVLHSTYNLTSCLSNLLIRQTSFDQDSVQTADVIHKITYNAKISPLEPYFEELISFLLEHVQNKEDALMPACVGILANFCRDNASVQSYFKNMPDSLRKPFYQALAVHLSNRSDASVQVFSLSILFSLGLNNDLGDRLFRSKNIVQTFQMLINTITSVKLSTATRNYAVDLFTDLLKNARIRENFAGFDYAEIFVCQMLQMLPDSDSESEEKILEMLLTVSKIRGLRSLVARNVLSNGPTFSTPAHSRTKYTKTRPPYLSIVKLASQTLDTHVAVSLLAIRLIKDVYKDVDPSDSSCPDLHLDITLPMLTHIMMSELTRETEHIKMKCERLSATVEILICLCSCDQTKKEALKCVDQKTCLRILDFQFGYNKIVRNHSRNEPDDWSQSGVEVVIHTLNLLLKTHCRKFADVIQDRKVIHFLAAGMAFPYKNVITATLALCSECIGLDFPLVILAEAIASNNLTNNKSVNRTDAHTVHGVASSHVAIQPKPMPVLTSKENVRNLRRNGNVSKKRTLEETDESVQNLIDKIEGGMGLKDAKMSDLFGVYEHKLKSYETKENHLQDLLEAKALALSQADRLISQYRYRRVQTEAEAQTLRTLVQQSERRSEEIREELNEVMVESERLNADFDQANQENIRLEELLEDRRKLIDKFTDQNRRASEQICELRDQMLSAQQNLSDIEGQLEEMTKVNSTLTSRNAKLDKERNELEKERDELEKATDILRKDLDERTENIKQLKQKVSTLEKASAVNQKKIAKKDDEIRHHKDEISKFHQLTELINGLSSGKLDISKVGQHSSS